MGCEEECLLLGHMCETIKKKSFEIEFHFKVKFKVSSLLKKARIKVHTVKRVEAPSTMWFAREIKLNQYHPIGQ